jgi:hypothetical protein
MISGSYGVLQETAVSVFEDIWNVLKELYETYELYILIVIGLVVAYFALTRTIFRGSVYKTAQREPMCILTMAGRERSLEYLEKFGEIRGIEAQVIKYLRKNRSVPKKHLERTFGKVPVKNLIDDKMIKIV